MNDSKKIGLCLCAYLVAMAAGLAPAFAADVPVKAPMAAAYNWTGWYAGVEGGYAWGTSRLCQTGVCTNWAKTDGGFGGGTLGANWQTGNWVFGIETDISAAGIDSGPKPTSGGFGCSATGCETSVDWFGTTRGRVGYAWDRTLIYGTGGWAYGDAHSRINGAPAFDDGGRVRSGWTAGAGIEWALAGNWTAKVEYLRVDFGSYVFGTSPPTPPMGTVHFDLVRAGLNYKFDWGGARY